ncbi:MAG: hypothetical protein ACYCVD_18760 [Desulfitobacteriaceae bacterium]
MKEMGMMGKMGPMNGKMGSMKGKMGSMKGMMGPMNGMMEMFGVEMNMGKRMRDMAEKELTPWEMYRQMTQSVTKSAEMGSYATPEIRDLFEDWVSEVEKEILEFISSSEHVEPKEIGEKLRLKEESVLFFVGRLAQQGKIRISGIQLSKEE